MTYFGDLEPFGPCRGCGALLRRAPSRIDFVDETTGERTPAEAYDVLHPEPWCQRWQSAERVDCLPTGFE